MRSGRRWTSLFFALAAVLCVDTLCARNIVGITDRSDSQPFTANPVRLTDTEVSEFLFSAPRFSTAGNSAESARITSRLETQVISYLDDAPWKPFQHPPGISGHEVYFDHHDELFHNLSVALPCLSVRTAPRGRGFLREELEKHPPCAEAGYDRVRLKTAGSAVVFPLPSEGRGQGEGWKRAVGRMVPPHPGPLPRKQRGGRGRKLARHFQSHPVTTAALDAFWEYCHYSGNLCFIEKSVYAFWVAGGRPWKTL